MNAALNLYDSFEPRTDCYFFRIGSHGQICFHGRNYTIKKRFSAEETASLTQDSSFVKVASDCYVNLSQISNLVEDAVYFGEGPALNHRLAVSRRKQHSIRQQLALRLPQEISL